MKAYPEEVYSVTVYRKSRVIGLQWFIVRHGWRLMPASAIMVTLTGCDTSLIEEALSTGLANTITNLTEVTLLTLIL